MGIGIPFQVPPPPLHLHINVSLTSWDMNLYNSIVVEVGSLEEKELYINIIEMKMVQVTLNSFLPRILGESIVFMSDNTTVVAYQKKKEVTVCK